MKYRIVRRWTTITNTSTGEIVETSVDRFYIQGRNFFTAIFGKGWKDLHIFGFNSLKEAQDELGRRLKKQIKIKKVEHQMVEVEI